MTAVVLVLGWLCAGGALAALAAARREQEHRRELVARACHEIRQPLTAAGLALHAGALSAAQTELRRAARVTDDLWAARDGRDGGDAEGLVELGGVLEAQLPAWRASAAAAGRTVVLARGRAAWVAGDPERLAQVASNLVANALEHGAGTVRVALRTQGPRVRVEVADEGSGLPAPVAQLADRARCGSASRGRGLAIAAEIARRHGGRLSAAPTARGARLVLELPAPPSAPAGAVLP